MFANLKAQKIYSSHQHTNQTDLKDIDQKVISQNGPSYQQAIYTEFSNEKVCFIPFGYDNQFAPVYAIYGWMLEEQDLGLVRLNLVKTIQEQVLDRKQTQRGISLIFFSHANSKQKPQQKHKKKTKLIEFTSFKESVLKQIQSKYLRCIKGVYVCHEGFLIRSLSVFSLPKFGLHNQLVEALIIFCHKLQNLVESLGPLFQCQLIRQQVQEYNGSIEWLDIFSEVEKKMAKRKMVEQLGQFDCGSSFYKRNISDYQLQYETGIPLILKALLKALESNQLFLETEGLFRKACDSDKLRKLENELEGCVLEQHACKIASKYDPLTIACCIKTIFNKLNPPIISFDIYDVLVTKMNEMYKELQPPTTEPKVKIKMYANQPDSSSEEETTETRPQDVKRILQSVQSSKIELPQQKVDQLLAYLSYYVGSTERIILLLLIKFFIRVIMPNEKRNKMGAYNLSVVMGPCLFRPKKYTVSDLVNSPRLANLLFNLIRFPQKIE